MLMHAALFYLLENCPAFIIQPQNVTLVLNGTILHFSLTCKANVRYLIIGKSKVETFHLVALELLLIF